MDSNRLITAGLEPFLSLTKKSCITLYYKKIFTNVKIKILELIPGWFVSPSIRHLVVNKTGFNPIIYHFNIREKLSTIRHAN